MKPTDKILLKIQIACFILISMPAGVMMYAAFIRDSSIFYKAFMTALFAGSILWSKSLIRELRAEDEKSSENSNQECARPALKEIR
jgi:hypothetical protein